jgi:hypothetical protein
MFDIGHDPTPGGVTPTPTKAGDVKVPTDTAPAQGRSGTFVAPPGIPFYTAALAARAAGYDAMQFVTPDGTATTYPTTAEALAQYARNTGAQSSAAAARALAPVPSPAPFAGIPAQSIPPMGGNAASLIYSSHVYQTSPWQPNGSGTVWATSPLQSGPVGGVPAAEATAGGPPTTREQAQATGSRVTGA